MSFHTYIEKMNNKNQRIQVFARCRPLNNREKSLGSPSIVEVIPEKKQIAVKDRNHRREFFFDKVFSSETDQIAVYKNVVEPLIQEVLMGYNCTVFAYGQTGTGKTYTMEGERSDSNCSWEKDKGAGIIPRSLHQLFEELNKEENVEFSVRVSFLELYNEELFDLLGSTEFSKLRLYEDPVRKGSVIIQGLEEITVNSKDAVYAILERGTSRRQTATTMLNATSSRSHTVFSVTVHIKENTVDGEELLKTGKLNLVDLAGSENVGRSGAVDKRAREAGNINQSLLTLGRVITSLIEKQPHVPYRESKLTRLLQDSLGGHTKTSIIATISPAQVNVDETISTLDYATKAKSITIRPEANQKMTKRALLREYTEEIERLKRDLTAARLNEGFFINAENYKSMERSISEKSDIIKELNEKIEAFIQKNLTLEQEKSAIKEELEKRNQLYEEVVTNLSETSEKLNLTQEKLSKTALERDETKYLLNIHTTTEKKLSAQAQTLLDVTYQTTADINGLHAKLKRKQTVEQTNEEQSESFKQSYKKQFANLDEMIVKMKSQQCCYFNNIEESLDQVSSIFSNIKQKFNDVLHNAVVDQKNQTENFILNMKKSVTDHKNKISSEINYFNSKKIELSTEQEAFLTGTYSQIFNQLHDIRKEMDELVLNKLNEVTQGIRQYHSCFLTRSGEKIGLIETMKNSLDSFYGHHENLLKELEEKTKCLVSLEEENEESLKEELLRINEFLNSRLKMGNKRKDKICQVRNLQTGLLNNCEELKSKEVSLESLKNLENESISDLKIIIEKADNVDLNEIISKQNLTDSTMQSLSTELIDFVKCNQKKEDTIFTEIENTLADNSKRIQTNCEAYESELKNITMSLSEFAEKENLSIKEQNDLLVSKICGTQSIIDYSKQMSNQNTDELKKEVAQRDLEFEKFLQEDLKKDLPTGTTPQKRTYEYPKSLATTSPDEKLLQNLHLIRESHTSTAINSPLDSSPDDNFAFKSPSKPDPTGSTNTLFDSEEDYLTGCETESNSSSMSDLTAVGLKNKENLKRLANLPNKSHLPKIKKLKFSDSDQPTSAKRKPLISKNLQSNS